jgi:hypothetical protein
VGGGEGDQMAYLKIISSSSELSRRATAKASSPQPIGVIDGGRPAGCGISAVVDVTGGSRHRRGGWGHCGQGAYCGDGHERPDSADRENEGSDDVAPNAHDSSMRLPRSFARYLASAAPPTPLSVFFIHQSAADFMYYADIESNHIQISKRAILFAVQDCTIIVYIHAHQLLK